MWHDRRMSPPIHPEAIGPAAIEEHTLRLADRVAGADLGTPVATCGDWNLADLTWHLLEVQHFWTHIIEQRPAGPESYERLARPADEALPDALRSQNHALLAALAGLDPAEPAWSWSNDHSVGFTLRRQSHEALIHAIDGDLATGAGVPPIAAALAADGVDELLTVMLDAPAGVELRVDTEPHGGAVVSLETTDTGDTWQRRMGRVTVEGRGDIAALAPVTGAEPDATIRGRAIDLDCWLWGRADIDALTVSGDPDVAAALRQLVVSVSQ